MAIQNMILWSPYIRLRLRLRQRGLVRAVSRSPIRYSGGSGDSPDDAIVITGARTDHEGTGAVFAWMFDHLGTMDVDWRIREKSGAYGPPPVFDIYHVEMCDGPQRTLYFDITDHYLKP